MSSRINLNDTEFSNRIRNFDSYIHNSSSSRTINDSTFAKKPYISHTVNQSYPKLSKPKDNYSIENQNNSRRSLPEDIAMRSVADSKELANDEGYTLYQFSDKEFINFTPIKTKSRKFNKLIFVMGSFALIITVFATLQLLVFNEQAIDQIAALGVTTDAQGVSVGTGNEPSEELISNNAIAKYNVDNLEDPRYIRLPDIGIIARVKKLDFESIGTIDAPGNINDVGWHSGSARPGSEYGSSLIIGHVSGTNSPGVFSIAKELNPGSIVEIEKGNGKKIKFMVKQSRNVSLSELDLSEILTPDNPNEAELNLMTISNNFNRDVDKNDERLIIQAIKI